MMLIMTDIRCDGDDCLEIWLGTDPYSEARIRYARKYAKLQAWTYSKGKDLCPSCSKKCKSVPPTEIVK